MLAAVALGGGGCKDKKRERRAPVPVAALAAVPADATVVVGIDVPQLAHWAGRKIESSIRAHSLVPDVSSKVGN